MKKIKLFEEFTKNSINEKASWGVDVEEPLDERSEINALNKFEIAIDPIVAVGASGYISFEDSIDISIQFSNGESIDSDYSSYASITIEKQRSPIKEFNENVISKYWGSTGTVVGDVCLIYRDFKQGKLK